jgi:hypothetical protein
VIVPSDRGDELGRAERELAAMQTELAETLRQKSDWRPGAGWVQDQPRSAQYAVERPAHFRSHDLVPDPTVQAFRAEADRLARPRHPALHRDAEVWARQRTTAGAGAFSLVPLIEECAQAVWA